MCGIAGFTHPYQKKTQQNQKIIQKMTTAIQHRGPDDSGSFLDTLITLGHRRLSIIDPSPLGHQPMSNQNQSIFLVFNGEIYNFQNLKTKLLQNGHSFQSQSDSEIIIHLYQEYQNQSISQFLSELNGMFAFALWDQKKQTLLLARDPAGEKPLYYSLIQNQIVFASEIKAILQYPHFKKQINPLSLSQYLTHDYVPSPYTIFHNLYRLPAGHFLIFKNSKTSIQPFWDLQPTYPYHTQFNSKKQILSSLDQILFHSVQSRLISDFPVGLLLSGGIDSTTILYYLSKIPQIQPIQTFSIGFHEKSFDESFFAKDVANYFQTKHHHQTLTPQKLLHILPEITQFLDEPFADPSIIPTYLLSKFTRQSVKVALTGDGGDEIFMGYPTFQANQIAQFLSWLPKPLFQIALNILNLFPHSHKNMSLHFKLQKFLSGIQYPKNYREQVWLGSFTPQQLPKLQNSPIPPCHKIFQQTTQFLQNYPSKNSLEKLAYWYFKTYLQDDILVKSDRASMATSLELRAPLLDPILLQFSQSIPSHFKLHFLNTKYILKQLLNHKVPQHVLTRSKKGFGIPVSSWIQKPLKNLFTHTLSKQNLNQHQLFNPQYVHNLLSQHLSNHADHRKPLWNLFIFQLWFQKWIL